MFGGDVSERKHLGRFLYELRKGHGGVFVGRVVIGDYRQDLLRVRERFEDCYTCLNDTKIVTTNIFGQTSEKERRSYNAFAPLELCLAENFYKGACNLMQNCGVGAIRPNTVVLGYKEDWIEIDDPVGQPSRITTHQYVQTLQVAFKMRYGVLLCRNMDQVQWNAPSPDGTVDVWSLLDDGGLTFLVPYIMAQAPFWKANTAKGKKTLIRLFFIFADGHNNSVAQQKFNAEWKKTKLLLAKYRFDWQVMDPAGK